MNVVVTGSLGFDYIMDFSGRFADRIMDDKVHKISLSFLVDSYKRNFGGTSGNFAYTLKLLGVNPLILSSVGNDFLPYEHFLKKQKIETKYITQLSNLLTGTYFGVTDKDDNQIGAYYGGPLKNNIKLKLSSINERIDFVHLSPDNPRAMVSFVEQCQKQKLKYLYDPAFQIGDFAKDELANGIKGAEIVIGNDYEVELMLQKLEISHEELRTWVPMLITTLGSKGSVVETRKQSIHIKPTKPKNTSDPTGAGDAYRAGFVAGYLRNFDLTTCGQMGSVAAVYTVEKYGTQTHSYTINDFTKRYKENYHTNLNL